MQVIAISGRKRSGKDTIADYIIDVKKDVKKVQFARPLKELFLKSYNKYHANQTLSFDDVDGSTVFDREELIDNDILNPENMFVDFIYNFDKLAKTKYDGILEFDYLEAVKEANSIIKNTDKFSVRKYLEFMGTEITKVSDKSIWAKLAILDTINTNVGTVVIPDLRFDEELEEIELLRKDGKYNVTTIKIIRDEDYVPTHSSDVPLPNDLFDYVIKNDRTIVDLYNTIENILGFENDK